MPPLATSLSKVFKFHIDKKDQKSGHMKQLPHTHVVQCNKMFDAKIVCQHGHDKLILIVETHLIILFF